MKTDPKARFQGYSFYFREGFCWSAINGTRSSNDLKFRFKQKSVIDVQCMSLQTISKLVTSKFVVCLCNSNFVNRYTESFVNSTVIFQINDAKQLPIIIPTKQQLLEFEKLFNKAVSIKKKEITSEISAQNAEMELAKIQDNLNIMVNSLYQI